MNTILAKSWQNEPIYNHLFNNSDILLDYQIMPFSSWVSNNSSQIVDSFPLYHAYQNINNIKSKLTLLIELVDDPLFISQVFKFYETCIEYKIDLNNLPEDTLLHQEMKHLLLACSSIVTQFHQRNEILEFNTQYNDISISEESIDSLSIHNFVNKKHLNIIKRDKMKSSSLQFFHALNIRQEVEACAQMIVSNNIKAEDINIVLCSYDESISYLKLIFTQYNIPFSCINESTKSKIVQSFIALTHWLLHSNLSNFKECISSPLLSSIDYNATIEYCDLFLKEIQLNVEACHVANYVGELNHVAEYQKEYLLRLEASFEKTRTTLLEILNSCDASNPLEQAYEILRESNLINDPQERNCLTRIAGLLNQIEPNELNNNLIDCILFQINKITITNNELHLNRVVVSNLSISNTPRKYLFVLNANSKHYPGNNSFTGLFEEEYVSHIKCFPSQIERASFFNKIQSWIMDDAEHTILSYATNTFEGKGLECSFEIKEMAQKDSTQWPLIQDDYLPYTYHSITRNTAKQIFIRDNQIHGSISSFEKHFKCPYSYFLHSGLKLRKANQIEFNQAMVGSIQHACIEEALNLFKSNYADCSYDELKSIVEEQFHAVSNFFISEPWIIQNIKERCIENLSLQFKFLSDFEKYSDLKNHVSEVPFETTLFSDEEISIALKGFIDRIDTNLNLYRIVDFKSSAKKLQIPKVKIGVQLQLLTYMYAASLQLNQKCAGAYYYSLKNDNVSIDAAKFSLRPHQLTIFDEETHFESWLSAHRLSGVTTNKSIENDNNGQHIVGWNEKGISDSKVQDPDNLFDILIGLYQILRTHLISGKITCTPVEHACTFCDFKNICRFQGRVYKTNINEKEVNTNA